MKNFLALFLYLLYQLYYSRPKNVNKITLHNNELIKDNVICLLCVYAHDTEAMVRLIQGIKHRSYHIGD